MNAGRLIKMRSELRASVEYSLVLGEQTIPLNSYIGRDFQLSFTGNIYCIQCGRKTKQSFQQGHCYPCMRRLAECGYCIIHPEKCRINEGHCSENDWAHAHCGQAHIVYLANSSSLKVGVTRQTQTPTRWIDQGASQALPIYRVTNRYQSGMIETCLKQFVNDKTNWRKMLTKIPEPLDLSEEWAKLKQIAAQSLMTTIQAFPAEDIVELSNSEPVHLKYPVLDGHPISLNQLSFDKTPQISGTLLGIKGQYLLLNSGLINIRKFSGYEVCVDSN